MKTALKVHDGDNVATAFAEGIAAGEPVAVCDKKGRTETVTVMSDIPYGHKIALRDIRPGEPILKYGEKIGVATRTIQKGDYVHIHNLDSTRGRGDL